MERKAVKLRLNLYEKCTLFKFAASVLFFIALGVVEKLDDRLTHSPLEFSQWNDES